MLDAQQLYKIVEAQQGMLGLDDIDAALAHATRCAMEVTGAVGAVIEILQGSEMLYHTVAGSLAGHAGVRLRRSGSMSGACIEAGVAMRADHAISDPRVDRTACQRLNVASMVCVPLGGQVPGVIKVVSSQPAAFDAQTEESLEIFARAVATRLERARRRDIPVSSPPPTVTDRGDMLDAILGAMQEAVVVIDTAGRVLLTNDRGRKLVSEGEHVGRPQVSTPDHRAAIDLADRPIMRALRGETVREHELSVRFADGGVRWFSVNSNALRDGDEIYGAVSVARDITELRIAREAVEAAAIHDELTGLLNRRGFLERATSALRLADRSGRPVALLYMDLNGLKVINDQLGHSMGDRALVEFSEVLRGAVRTTDHIARLGGDEYVVLAVDCPTEADVAVVKRRIEEAVVARATPDRKYTLSVSVGAIRYEPEIRRATIEQLLSEADARMYESKQRRKRGGTQRLERALP